MKIYTKTGDKGTTSLVGGTRVSKHHIKIESYGTVDELNSNIGLFTCQINDVLNNELLFKIQNTLFNIGSHLASEPGLKFPLPEIKSETIELIEKTIDKMNEELPELRAFILPGGSLVVGQIHVSRCVCRRAERLIVLLNDTEQVKPEIITFLNRLSDYLFVLARYIAFKSGIEEIKWDSKV